MGVFEFFFAATAGIAAGLAVVVIPSMYVYNRYFNSSRRNRA
ncbi:hypothetical protein [Desulfofundulus salinus]|nr:hypothetical protein [Desulfofundulus salinum]